MTQKKRSEKDFASKMKRLRKKSRISLERLARDCGHSVEYLEKVEAGKVMPPVSAILQISKALTVDAGAFLSEDKDSRKKKAEAFDKRKKAYSYKILTPDAAHKHMKAFLVTIDPEKEHEGTEYQHEGEEFIYVLDGRLDIKVGRKSHKLKKGQSLHFNSNLVHVLSNPGKKKTELLVMVYTP